MTKSPLARVVASKSTPAQVVSTAKPNEIGKIIGTWPGDETDDQLLKSLEEVRKPTLAVADLLVGDLKEPKECRIVLPPKEPAFVQTAGRGERRPDFGQFIDEFCEKNKITYTPYVDPEAKTRADVARITAALSDAFRGWDVHEHIEDAEYKPPFSPSWTFTKKVGSK